MAESSTIHWSGQSGRTYEYWVFPIHTEFSAEPGNYVYAKETDPGYFAPIYVGETSDLSTRFSNHHKAECIHLRGATHIHVHRNANGRSARQAEEADIVAKWEPPCND